MRLASTIHYLCMILWPSSLHASTVALNSLKVQLAGAELALGSIPVLRLTMTELLLFSLA